MIPGHFLDRIFLEISPQFAGSSYVHSVTFSLQALTWVRRVHIALHETHLKATERHVPCEITQCNLPPDTGKRAMP